MTTGAPHVVVGVHLHDGADALRRSLPTVVHQRFSGHLQVLVVDDGAGTAARAALDELCRRYPDIRVVRHAERLGRAASRNRVLAEAGGAAVAWLDLGDVWHPRKIAVQHATLLAAKDPARTLVASSHRRVDLTDRSEEVVDPDLSGDLLRALVERTLHVPFGTLLGSADAHRLVGGLDDALPYRDDEDFLLRFLSNGGNLVSATGGPLSTGSVVRDLPTARDVAVAEHRIRRRHRETVRAGGSGSARRRHRRELQRIARLHRKEGRRAVAGLYRLRADTVAVLDRLARTSGSGHAPSGDAPTAPPGGSTVAGRPADPPVPPQFEGVHEAGAVEDWSAAIVAWESTEDDVRAGADPATWEVIARALRASERYEDAAAVARAGLVCWPAHPRLEMELAKSRAATIDWGAAFLPMAPGEPTADSDARAAEPTGEVTSLGVLAGGEGFVTGWVADDPSPLPVEVSLHVGETTVVTTYAQATDPDDRGRLAFSLSCEQLLEFLGDGDRITIRTADRLLPIVGFGAAAEVQTGFESRMPALRARLDAGAVFTKFGRLRPGYTPARKRRTLDLVDEVAAVVHEAHGYACTPFYGNLLGAVREQDFIAHDVGGFDLGYVSGERDPAAVRDEFAGLCRRLLDHGYHLELEPFGAMIRKQPGDRIFVDLNFAWLTDAEELRLSYGWRYEPVVGGDAIAVTRDTFLAGRLVPIPTDAEAVLHQVYGHGWATPDQGFELARDLQRDDAFLLGTADLEALRTAAPDRVVVLASRD
ncbi:glycosyltransferase [Nitriliruptor alkaliphilus]|uniref:glycosyltransferase n=1 Tax=Nitriliruptor alkaliphilus TaxID=427918 RepID=UPI000696D976|nr:glycosyltransferase [Nitriliruptor alkaliphilus]